ncbi:MAG TPA: dihydrofolate reductase [Tepidisphaeraceae bacterium]|jgi:dihydrofolate reductase
MTAAAGGLELVVAVSRNGVIGRAGTLPWHLPDDLKHFKNLTLGHTIIMGRRTYESIGKPLPGRTNIVVSTTMPSPPAAGVILAHSLGQALERTSTRPFIIGGSQLYQTSLPRASVLHVTEIEADVEGDTFFPTFDRSEWNLIDDRPHPADERHLYPFHFRTYERIEFKAPRPPE